MTELQNVGDTKAHTRTTYSISVKDPKDHRSYSVAHSLTNAEEVRAKLADHADKVRSRNGQTIAKLGWAVQVRRVSKTTRLTVIDPDDHQSFGDDLPPLLSAAAALRFHVFRKQDYVDTGELLEYVTALETALETAGHPIVTETEEV